MTNTNENGFDLDQIKQRLRIPRMEEILAELVDEGMLYNTISDRHYAAV